ncbi:MAG: peptidoglycan-binding protein [Patescibacteria group bacterium]|nr:peptidoglycan-binding protein [Patescibacteria group bacterium]
MSTFGKKFVSIALMATVTVWASGALLFVPAANAQSSSDLQAQIAQLLAQIQQLQAQLNTAQGGTAMMSSSLDITRDLTVGSTGDDVKKLQQWLNANGAKIADSGAGSPGNETTFFGPLTQTSLGKWQAAHNVSPPAGYFGPVTRAKISSLASATPSTPPSTPNTPSTPPSTPSVPAPSAGLAVGISSQNPAAGSLISSSGSAAARVPVLAVSLTAGTASGMTVNALKFHKTGVLSDSSISGAYVEESGKVLSQYTSISNGVVSFPGLSLNIAAGQTRHLTLSIDPAQALYAGNTVGFAMTSTSDVSATDATGAAVTPSGSFPLNGNTFTVTSVSNPSIASLTVASSSIGTTVYAGTKNVIVGAWSLTGSNSKIWLKGINFKVIGSANKSDIQNIKLYVNGTQTGQTIPVLSADGQAYFDLSAAPGTINTGSNNVQVYADVMGSPNFNFQFEILNAYDILAVDSQYNVPVTAGSNTGTQVSINAGSVTVTAASDTPTGNIATGQTSVTLAKYTVYAAGEPVKVKWLTFQLAFTSATSTLDNMIKNVHLDDDAGGQVGTTISSLQTTATCTGTAFSSATTTATNCFGSSGSPINYIIPANTTRVLSLKGDVQSVTAAFSTVKATLTAGSSNLQGLISSATASSGSASGSALTLASSALTVAKNSAVGSVTVAKGAGNQKVGSYAFSASSAEGVTVSNLTVALGAAGALFQNLKVKIGDSQFGNTTQTLANSGSYSFSGTPFTVPAGNTTYVDVYADVLSSASAGTKTAITTLSGCSGSGLSSYTAVSCTSTAGQDVVVAGQSTVDVSLDSSLTPAAGQIVMGSNGITLAAFRLTETTNIEDIKITDLNVFQQVAATSTTKSAFGNLKLYTSDDLVNAIATAGSANEAASSSNPGFGYYYAFHFTSPVVVPQSNAVSLVLKGDVSSYNSSGATDNTTHVFKIATSTDTANDTLAETIVALGSTSNNTSSISFTTPNANALTVLRTKLTVTGTNAATTARTQTAVDDIGTINFAADSAGALQLSSVTITFAGSAPSTTNFYNATSTATGACATCYVTLYDTNNGTTYNPIASSTTSLSFDLGNYSLTANTSKSFTLRLNTAQSGVLVAAGSASTAHSLSATISAAGNVTWVDALSGGSTGLSLPAAAVPVTISSVSYTY